MNFVMIKGYDNYVNANIELGMLQEHGITCHLKDEHSVTIDPLLSPAIGGIKLMVADKDVEDALRIMEMAEASYISEFTCPACAKKELVLKKVLHNKPLPWWKKLANLIAEGGVVTTKKFIYCNHCGHDYKTLAEINNLK